MSAGSKTGFLDLPLEIRETIYRFAFSTQVDYETYWRAHEFWHQQKPRLCHLLRTCETVYNEAHFYLYDPFVLQPFGEVPVSDEETAFFLDMIGQRNA